MTEPLAPLVPADCDLRGYEFMPFFGHHLLGSEFHAQASDAAWRAGVTLWWAAWNQVPAASLPNDDAALARLADLGRDVKGWKKLRDHALHGFVLCSDGRLYHRFLAPLALEAWDRRVKEREKKRKWREAKNGSGDRDKDRDGTGTETGTRPGTEPGRDRDVPAERRGEDRERTGKELQNPAASQLASSPAASPPAVGGGMNGHDQSDAVVERIPLVGGVEFEVRQSLVAELDRLYPAVEPVQTLREIRGWCLGNPNRRKTLRGVKAFITSWFSREQNKPQRVN